VASCSLSLFINSRPCFVGLFNVNLEIISSKWGFWKRFTDVKLNKLRKGKLFPNAACRTDVRKINYVKYWRFLIVQRIGASQEC
jgi:hypothetical protein